MTTQKYATEKLLELKKKGAGASMLIGRVNPRTGINDNPATLRNAVYKAAKNMQLEIKTELSSNDTLMVEIPFRANAGDILRNTLGELLGAGGSKLVVVIDSATLDKIGRSIAKLRPLIYSVATSYGISVSTRYNKQTDELIIVKSGVARR